MRCHATDGSEKDLRWSSMMEGARLFRVDDMAFVEEVMVSKLENQMIIRICAS